MLLDNRTFLDKLIKLKVNPEQLLLLSILYEMEMARREGTDVNKHRALLYEYNEKIKPWRNIRDLLDRGIIISKNRNNSLLVDFLEVNESYLEDVLIPDSYFNKFWNKYPGIYMSSKGSFTLKATIKEDVEKLFNKRMLNKEIYNEMMEGLEYGIRNKLINMKIDNFLGGCVWDDFLRLKREKTDKESI